MIAQHEVCNIELRQVVGVRTAEHLFKMPKIRHHGHNVVLNVAEVEANVTSWSYRILLVATFGKPFDDVGLPTQQTHQAHHFLSEAANLGQEVVEILYTSNKHLIFNCL